MFDPNVIVQRREVLNKLVQEDIWSIWYAAQYGKVERLETILDRDPSVIDNIHPSTKWTALQYTAKYGHDTALEFLLKFNANVHIKDVSGNTALHLCASW